MELHGETAKFVEQAEDAIIAVSNYRLHIKFKESLVNVSGQDRWGRGRGRAFPSVFLCVKVVGIPPVEQLSRPASGVH